MFLSIRSVIGIFSATLVFVACQKDVAVPEQSTAVTAVSSSDAAVNNEFSNCKIRRIYQEAGSGQLISGLFTYNKAGNPVSLTFAEGGTGDPNWYFFYDKQDRLRELRVGYTPDDPLEGFQHRYGYDASNRITVDTTLRNFTEIQSISTITYDAQGRVVKESVRDANSKPLRNPTYTYDNRGNLGVNGWKSSSYDNKVSIFRSHPLFQFIFKNYSKNNAAPQPRYNSIGLPLSMYPANDAFFNADPASPAFDGEGIYKVLYDCQ